MFPVYIPHETITCDDRNPPWWMIKSKTVFHKNRAFNSYSRDRNKTDLFNKLMQVMEIHI